MNRAWSTRLLPGRAPEREEHRDGPAVGVVAGTLGYAGDYEGYSTGHTHPFVASQASRTWQDATDVKGDPDYPVNPIPSLLGHLLPGTGDGTVGLNLEDARQVQHAFVVSEASGTWQLPHPGHGLRRVGGVSDRLPRVGLGNCASPRRAPTAKAPLRSPRSTGPGSLPWRFPGPPGWRPPRAPRPAAPGTGGGSISGESAAATAIGAFPAATGIGGDFPVPKYRRFGPVPGPGS